MSIRNMDAGIIVEETVSPEFLIRQETRREALAAEMKSVLPAGPVVLEIGCGHGHYLTAYAKSSDAVCVGIDICRDRIARATRKRDRAKLRNLFFFRCDAADFLMTVPDANILSRVIILFPDPWPKRRHHKNRLLSAEFLADLAAKTDPGCDLYFRTDHRPYFDATRSLFDDHPDWQLAPQLPWPFEQPTVFQNRAESFSSLAAVRREKEEEEPSKKYPSKPSGTPEPLPLTPAASR